MPLLTVPRQKQLLHKLVVAISDIGYAHKACQHLINQGSTPKTDPLYYQLYCAVVICYSRPFTPNRPYGALQKDWSNFPTPEQRRLHVRILEARNTMVAHSDHTRRRVGIIISPLEPTDPPECYCGHWVEDEFFQESLFPPIKSLCELLLAKLQSQAQQLTMALVNSGQFGVGSHELEIVGK